MNTSIVQPVGQPDAASAADATRNRRRALAERMRRCGGGVALIPTANEALRNRDAAYPFRADSYFHYLTGFCEPEAVLVMCVGASPADDRNILFCRDKNEEREIWDGFRHGPDAARDRFGFDEGRSIGSLDAALPDLLADSATFWYSLGNDAEWDKRITVALNAVRGQARSGKRAPVNLRDVRAELDVMRRIKDVSELQAMRAAAVVSGQAHARAMSFARPGRMEYEVEAEILHEFRRHGCEAPAYTSIVAGGANACVLHYISNDCPLKDGDLLLIDAGAEWRGYAADITRTFPVGGRFSAPQAEAYQLVLEAQAAAIRAIRLGARFIDPHDAALRVLAQGMLDLKLLRGSLDEVIETESYKRFYMHRTSHWLGKDVHDAGEYKEGEAWTELLPGMVLTVEPGIYIRRADDVPESFWDIGIRIEDDAVVTTNGCEIITAGAPKDIAEIEALMRETAGGNAGGRHERG